MDKISPKYITDADGNRTSVILSIEEFDSLLEMLEGIEDVKLYDRSKSSAQSFRESEEVFKEIDKKKYI